MISVANVFQKLVILSMLLTVTGCTQFSYYLQSFNGHMQIMNDRQSIDDLIADPNTDKKLVERLLRVQQIREFAINELALPESGSYTRYVDLQRDYVLKNLFATKEFSITPESWCYPVVGCASYRGYFNEQQLQQFIDDLQQLEPMDVYVGNVPAYSTLGWFDDPVLNTFIHWPDMHLAGLIFHELTHQLIYVSDDSTFNESLASAVQQAGVERWLSSQGETQTLQQYQQFLSNRQSVIELIIEKREELQKFYAKTMDIKEKRIGKQTIIGELKRQYRGLTAGFTVKDGFSRWFDKDINNAQLASVSTYYDYVPAFRRMLEHHDGHFKSFYQHVERLASLSLSSRSDCMEFWHKPLQNRESEYADCY